MFKKKLYKYIEQKMNRGNYLMLVSCSTNETFFSCVDLMNIPTWDEILMHYQTSISLYEKDNNERININDLQHIVIPTRNVKNLMHFFFETKDDCFDSIKI